MKWPPNEWHNTSLMISQHWFRLWKKAITQVSVDPDLCTHMMLLDHNKSKNAILSGQEAY